jgi:putative oxidoreductase
MTRDRALLLLRLAAGGVFVVFGAGKFVNHAAELASFRTYGLPAPEVLVVAIGIIELVGGLLLVAGVLTSAAALVLAGDMVAAIGVSGIARGELISLRLAPAELVAMAVLLWLGPGAYAVSRRRPLSRSPGPVGAVRAARPARHFGGRTRRLGRGPCTGRRSSWRSARASRGPRSA